MQYFVHYIHFPLIEPRVYIFVCQHGAAAAEFEHVYYQLLDTELM